MGTTEDSQRLQEGAGAHVCGSSVDHAPGYGFPLTLEFGQRARMSANPPSSKMEETFKPCGATPSANQHIAPLEGTENCFHEGVATEIAPLRTGVSPPYAAISIAPIVICTALETRHLPPRIQIQAGVSAPDPRTTLTSPSARSSVAKGAVSVPAPESLPEGDTKYTREGGEVIEHKPPGEASQKGFAGECRAGGWRRLAFGQRSDKKSD